MVFQSKFLILVHIHPLWVLQEPVEVIQLVGAILWEVQLLLGHQLFVLVQEGVREVKLIFFIIIRLVSC